MNMVNLDTKIIKQAVYRLCYDANTRLNYRIYARLLSAYQNTNDINIKLYLAAILKNAKLANKNKRPLCQDTGQVIVFVSIGQEVSLKGELLSKVINEAVAECYTDNFFRKSVVKDALFDRDNTKDNTPVIIYTDIVAGDEMKIDVLIKGAGAENKSKAQMLLPSSDKEDIIAFIGDTILESGLSSCPPLFIGVGIGGTLDQACVLSKKALFIDHNESKEKEHFASRILEYVTKKAPDGFAGNYVLDIGVKTAQTHMACLPVCVTLSCHSSREASCVIKDSQIQYLKVDYDLFEIEDASYKDFIEINTKDVEKIKKLKKNQNVLLSGEIIVARDAAHKRLSEIFEKGGDMPFKIKDSVIFYAGPCPSTPDEIIGPIGPTTASRMDSFAPFLYDLGMLATIGKGERNEKVKESIRKNSGVYFSVGGGIASLLANTVKKAEIIAFEDLGAEAIYRLQVEKLPVKVEVAAN